ncbi:MAG TPA: ClbS/DfsB family four-helix bundle protein [Pyrinomonadaceae bacterium]
MKYQSKAELIGDIRAQYELFSARLEAIPKSRWREPGVWGNGWTITDLVAHLAEWQFMFLSWYEAGRKGETPEMPAPGYKWNETPKLNRAIWARHRFRPADAIRAEFDGEFRLILEIIEALSPEQLLTPGHFRWTGKNPLATYLAPNTASHYRFALKVIERWLKRGATCDASAARNNHLPSATPSRPVRALQTGRVVR